MIFLTLKANGDGVGVSGILLASDNGVDILSNVLSIFIAVLLVTPKSGSIVLWAAGFGRMCRLTGK